MSLNIIIKRDGTEEIFDPNKIVNAIKKAFIGTGCTENPRKIAEEVCTQIIKSQKTPSVECVQDLVEKSLIEHNLYKEAKAYILYRNHRTEIRESKSELYDVVGSVLDNCNKDNANISNSPSAKMLQIGEAASERYYSNKVVSKKFVELHKAKRIHIHDFTFYGKTVNCLNIPLGKLLDEGFDNGHGTIRSPQKISSAAALAAIILQSNQNSMFGGQAFSKFDEDMAKYVQREYNRQYKQLLDEYCDINDTTVDEVGKNAYLISKLEKRAMENTDKETFQAMEALVYNLNSMHSRAGSQVPFSSISLGLDTTKWGRMITRNLLKAYRQGLGKGEQPIFPNIIFQVKKGVNRSEGDPNYDLFKESVKTTSSRLFPSYCNEDASFNLPYYNKGVKVAYMGCVEGNSVINYKIGDYIFVEGIERAYRRLKKFFKESTYGVSKYLVPEGLVSIYDSFSGKYVDCKKFIKNPNPAKWLKLTTSHGRTIVVTEDHPFPVIGKGRVFARDLVVGDKLNSSKPNTDFNTDKVIDSDVVWLWGIVICDASYATNVTISLGLDETDIVDKVLSVCKKLGLETRVVEQHRGVKGDYYDINILTKNKKYLKEYFVDLFGGLKKTYRTIPQAIFNSSYETKCAFIAGMIDADGYINDNRKPKVQLGSINHELAFEQAELVRSIGLNCSTYRNRYSKLTLNERLSNEFYPSDDIMKYMVSEKKKMKTVNDVKTITEIHDECEIIDIQEIIQPGFAYDVETSSDHFDVNGLNSHNCRTRVVTDVNGEDMCDSRGNLFFTTINLPALALEVLNEVTEENKTLRVSKFYEKLHDMIETVKDHLLERYHHVCKLKVKDLPFLMDQNLYIGSEGLDYDDTVENAFKHGSITFGFIGLAETLKALIGKHHGESEEALEIGEDIIKYIREKADEYSDEYHLNFTVIASPAESTCMKMVNHDKKEFGLIEGVTDKEWYTNSFHVPVEYNTDFIHKIQVEARFHKYCNGGHISYIELDACPAQNPNALEDMLNIMFDNDMGYMSINFPTDFCEDCGLHGVVISENTCPRCGGSHISRVRRVTGYLSKITNFNKGKLAELKHRVAHGSFN